MTPRPALLPKPARHQFTAASWNPGNPDEDMTQEVFNETITERAKWRAFVAVQEHLNYEPVDLESHGFVGGEGSPGSSRSRRNLGLYYDLDLPDPEVDWVDLEGTWGRTAKGAQGKEHEPRSILVATFEDFRVIVGHMPPDVADDSVRAEAWQAMFDLLHFSTLPTLMLWDGNDRREIKRRGELTSANLAADAGGRLHGNGVDCAVTVGDVQQVGKVRYLPAPGDHKHALDVTFQVPVSALWPDS